MPRLTEHTHRRLGKLPAALLGRPRARLGNPNTGIPEVVVQPIYDIYFVAPGSAFPLLRLFTVVQGQTYNFGGVTAFSKGAPHTTMVQSGMLESSYTFIVRALSLYVQGQQGQAHPAVHREDLENLLGSFFQFRINRKSYYDGIGAWLPGGGGQMSTGFGTLTAPVSSFTNTNGLAQSRNVYPLPGGQFINPQEQFDVIVDPTQNALSAGGTGAPTALAAAGNPAGVPAAGIGAWFRLDGTLIRVAQ